MLTVRKATEEELSKEPPHFQITLFEVAKAMHYLIQKED